MTTETKIEKRYLHCETKFASDSSGIIKGIAWPWSSDRGGDEIVRSGVKIDRDPVPVMYGHDGTIIVGLAYLPITDSGVEFDGRLLHEDIEKAAELRSLANAGLQLSLSIGFIPNRFEFKKGGGILYTDITIVECSIVAVGQHAGAHLIEVRSQQEKNGGHMPELDLAGVESAVVKAIEPVAAQVKAFEAIPARLDELEAKMNRSALAGGSDGAESTVMKAWSSFLRTGSDVELKAALSSNDPEGGYFIVPEVDRSIRNLLDDISPMRRLADVITIGGSTYERFYSVGSRGAQWVSESQVRPQDTNRPSLIKHSYNTMEMYAAPAGSRHLFEDASVDIAGWFNTWSANDFAVSEGEAFIGGDGTGGKPRGLYTYPIVAAADKTRPWGEMQYLPAGHASAPTDDNWAKALVKTVLTLHPNYRSGAAWLMSNATLIRIREIQDSNKRFMWSDHGNLSESPESGTLLGYPVHIDNNMEDIGTDKFPIAFGNFRQGYVVVDRHGIRVERDAVTIKGTILLDTYKRCGGGLGDSRAIKWLKVATS